MKNAHERFQLRKIRIRKKVSGSSERPRLCFYRGHKNLYAQIVDDVKGHTVVSACTLSAEIKGKIKPADTVPAAKAAGELIAKKALEKGIKKVVFDRGGYIYHGRIKAFADAARQAGLEF